MDEGLTWRLLGPVWATGMTLFQAFPITVPLAAVAAWRGSSREAHPSAFPRRLVTPGLLIVATWLFAAVFTHPAPPRVVTPQGWRSYVVLALLGLHIVLAAALGRRYRRRRGTLSFLALQFWIAVVATFIGLWWVEGWASI